jgi:hypothetical protein
MRQTCAANPWVSPELLDCANNSQSYANTVTSGVRWLSDCRCRSRNP